MDGLIQDLRNAQRALLRQRAFALAALLSLALGIGANTALFSVSYGVLLRPLPYRDPDRLVRVSEFHPGAHAPVRSLLSNFTLGAWRENARTIEGLGAYRGGTYLETSGAETLRIVGAALSPVLFQTLGARPAAGRLLLASDAAAGAEPVVVLSHALWRERFGAEPSAIGRSLVLDGKRHTIVGVAERDFYLPDRETRLWLPYLVTPGSADPAQQRISIFSALGRLRPGVPLAEAVAEGTAAARSVPRPPLADTIFGKGGPVEVRVETLIDSLTARVRPALVVLTGAVGFVLLICCANVANLLLSRGVARQRELAVRAAIGASRGRLIWQLVAESLLLSLWGGALGVALGASLLGALPALAPADFPRLADVELDLRALAFAAALSILAGLVAGVLPAFRTARAELLPALRDGVGASAASRTLRLGGALLVAEAALATILLVGASLLARSFAQLLQVDPGYRAANVLIARVYLGGDQPPERTGAFVAALLQRLRALPGVVAAGAANMAPLARNTALVQFNLPGASVGGEPVLARATSWTVTPGYAEALSLRLRGGRLLDERDLAAGVRSMLVNEEFVRAYLNDGRPVVGRRYQGLFGAQNVTSEIVGVVGNVLKDGLDARPQSEIYGLPRHGYAFPSEFNVVLRVTAQPLGFARTLRPLLAQLAPRAAVEVATLQSQLGASVSQPRFAAVSLAVFALLAVTLAAIGLYGVLSYNVSQRRRELGVRAALGASRGQIIALVVRQGLLVTAAGLALGVAGAAALTRLLERLLFGVTPLDGAAFAGALAVLLLAALLACLAPAWRAAGVDPTEALRTL
jgi:predicted permease